jgi:hypothetical protein
VQELVDEMAAKRGDPVKVYWKPLSGSSALTTTLWTPGLGGGKTDVGLADVEVEVPQSVVLSRQFTTTDRTTPGGGEAIAGQVAIAHELIET